MVFITAMKTVQLRDVDLNLLIVADVIFRHQNLTAAASELGLTPSAVSHALERLGRHYGSPLFVRATRGVVPTDLGKRLEPAIRAMRAAAERALDQGEEFDPKTAEARIYIATTEYFEVVVGHSLIKALRTEAPSLTVCFLDLMGQLPQRALEMGQVDMAIAGFFSDLPESLSRRKLFRGEFATIAGGKLPKTRPLTLDEYLAASHLLITLTGDLEGRVDTVLRAQGLRRRVVAATASFTTPVWLLRDEDIVLTAPRLLLKHYEEFLGFPAFPCPVETEGPDMNMVFHERTQKDPLRKWVRERIAELCREID